MQSEEGQPPKGTPTPGGSPRRGSEEPLPPILSAALEESGRSLGARLERIAAHSPSSARYTVLGEISRGGMGRVLRVWDNDLDRELAMKEILSRVEDEEDEEARAEHERALALFIDEARITSELSHPGIVPVHEIAVDGEGNLFFTMPLLRGKNLAEVLEDVRRGAGGWNRTRALQVLLNVCMTMAYAHEAGVVHRDLKPSNIMVGEFGETYVVDWGLALIVGFQEQRRVVGTVAYMSPEQAEARTEDVGPRSDVYSLGAILYELLTGRMPHALSLEQRPGDFTAIHGATPRPVSKVAHDIPDELALICEKAMAHDPGDRYENAEFLAKDLRAFLEDRVVESFDVSRMARIRKWQRRNPKLSSALTALGAVVVVASFAIAYLQWSKRHEVEAKQREADRNAYANDIRLADMHLDRGEAAQARYALAKEYEPPLGGWEREYLWLKLDSSLSTVRFDAGGRNDFLATSPDDATFVTVAKGTELRLWDSTSGDRLGSFAGHHAPITCAAFDPRGIYLASGDEDNRVILWNVRERRAVREFGSSERNITALTFSRFGSRLAWAEKGMLRVHDLGTEGSVVDIPHPGEDSILVLAPGASDAWFYTLGNERVLRLWNVDDGICVASRTVASTQVEYALAVFHDASLLAVGAPERVHLWNAATLEGKAALSMPGANAASLDFDPTGGFLAAGTDLNSVEVWDIGARRRISRQFGHTAKVNGIRFLPSGTRLRSWASDGTIRTWDPRGGAELLLEEHEDRVYELAFSRDGSQFYTGSTDGDVKSPKLRQWDGRTGELLSTTEVSGVVDCIAFHPRDGSFAYVTNEGATSKPTAIRLRMPGEPEDRMALRGHEQFVHTLAFDCGGDYLLSRSDDGSVRIWRMSDGQCLRVLRDLGERDFSLATHPTEEWFAVGTGSGDVQVRRISDGSILRILPWSSEIWSLAFNGDGSLLAGGSLEGTIVIWSLTDGAEPRLLRDPASMIQSFAFHPREPRIVSGAMDGTIRLWDVEREELLLTLGEDRNTITALAFSPQGDRIAAASYSHLRLWRTPASLSSPPGEGPDDGRTR